MLPQASQTPCIPANDHGNKLMKLKESLARLVCGVIRLAVGSASGDWQLSVIWYLNA
jgi:hypothetical protein